MQAAVEVASQGKSLVTFGIQPQRPEVGYGYVEVEAGGYEVGGLAIHQVKAFHEKPSLAKAQEYVASGRFFWNSGMFAWRVDTLWAQFQKHQPELAKAFEKAGELNPRNSSFQAKLKKIYKSLPDLSIDYGIMEKADAIEVVVPDFSWDDIGSWASLDRLHSADAQGNRKLGDAVILDTQNTTVFSDSGLVCSFGIHDALIVQHEGVTLVVAKSHLPRIKEIVKQVQAKKAWNRYL